MVTMKRCSRCQELKTKFEFTKRSMSKDGVSAACTSCLNKAKRENYINTPEVREVAKHRAKLNERLRKDRDPAYRNAWNAWRYAKEINRVPKWVKFTRDILPVYRELHCKHPVGWVVDHIIPFNGKTVSGLHVPSNLQFIPNSDNLSKAAAFTDELLDLYK